MYIDVHIDADVHIDVPCISMQSNLKNSPPIACNKISCKIMKIDFKYLSKMEILFFLKVKFGRL